MVPYLKLPCPNSKMWGKVSVLASFKDIFLRELCLVCRFVTIVFRGSGDGVDNGSFPLQRCPNR